MSLKLEQFLEKRLQALRDAADSVVSAALVTPAVGAAQTNAHEAEGPDFLYNTSPEYIRKTLIEDGLMEPNGDLKRLVTDRAR